MASACVSVGNHWQMEGAGLGPLSRTATSVWHFFLAAGVAKVCSVPEALICEGAVFGGGLCLCLMSQTSCPARWSCPELLPSGGSG